jgi:Na+:H+ antiporter, NhaA family
MAEENEPNGKLPVLRSAALHVHDRSGESRKELERLSNTLELWHREQAQRGRTVESRLRKLGDDAKKRVAINHNISGLKEARRRSVLRDKNGLHFEEEEEEGSDTEEDGKVAPQFWREKHVFAELDELTKSGKWIHTHRWNYGLEERLKIPIAHKQRSARASAINFVGEIIDEKVEEKARRRSYRWGEPQIPKVSIFGLADIADRLLTKNVMLDVKGFTFHDVIVNIIDKAIKSGIFPLNCRDRAIATLTKNEKRHTSSLSSTRRKSGKDFLDQCLGEEALLVKVGECDYLRESIGTRGESGGKKDTSLLIFARVNFAVEVGMDVHDARFIVIVLGSNSPEKRQLDIEIGCSFAALLQDEFVCAAAYNAQEPEEFIDTFIERIHHIKMVPNIHRPTEKGVTKRQKRLGRALSALAETSKQWAKWEARQNVQLRCNSLPQAMTVMQTYAIPLLMGIFFALIWANVDFESFDHWLGGHHSSGGGVTEVGNASSPARRSLLAASGNSHNPTLFGWNAFGHDVTIQFIVNDILMCFFFGLAVKEITEAVSHGGSMYPPQEKAINPLLGTFGGVFGPVSVYFLFIFILDGAGALPEGATFADVAVGWGIPTATDISLAWVTSLLCFGPGHPAVLYLLLLAVVDDGIGLIIIAVFYTEGTPNLVYLLLVLAAMALSYAFRRLKVYSWQIYVFLAGPLAWAGLINASLHPALALVFVVPFMPLHGEKKEGASEGSAGHDGEHSNGPLHQFEDSVKPFVDVFVLFLFGLVNAGVQVNYIGTMSISILLSLVVGKTLGIGLMSMVGEKIGYPAPEGIGSREAFMVGFIASLGLTVALFVSGVAFPASPRLQGEAKMGALLSIVVALIAILISRGICKFKVPESVARTRESDFDIDVDSDSDDEVIDIAMVRSMRETIKNVGKKISETEKAAGAKIEDIFKKSAPRKLERSVTVNTAQKSQTFSEVELTNNRRSIV